MKIAIFGGSGFMGYNLYRLLEGDRRFEEVVYCTSAKGLSNLARHDADIRYVPYPRLAQEVLDPDTEFVVNYGHPFQKRDNLEPLDQLESFCRFIERNRGRNGRLKLIHISSMSVYEPFGSQREFEETAPLEPPPEDVYANSKVKAEQLLRSLPEAESWQLILRPTVVYGPFCRPWTDNLLAAFKGGDVEYIDLDGKIQPIYGDDVSLFVRDRLLDFRPGIFNLPGPESVTWKDFFGVFQEAMGTGKLVCMAPKPPPPPERAPLEPPATAGQFAQGTSRSFVERLQHWRTERWFQTLVGPVYRLAPFFLVLLLRRRLGPNPLLREPEEPEVQPEEAAPPPAPDGPYCKPFFGEDRLVSARCLHSAFSDYPQTTPSETVRVLRYYSKYRFGDPDIHRADGSAPPQGD